MKNHESCNAMWRFAVDELTLLGHGPGFGYLKSDHAQPSHPQGTARSHGPWRGRMAHPHRPGPPLRSLRGAHRQAPCDRGSAPQQRGTHGRGPGGRSGHAPPARPSPRKPLAAARLCSPSGTAGSGAPVQTHPGEPLGRPDQCPAAGVSSHQHFGRGDGRRHSPRSGEAGEPGTAPAGLQLPGHPETQDSRKAWACLLACSSI